MQVRSLLVCWDGGDRTLNAGLFIASVLGQDFECRSVHC